MADAMFTLDCREQFKLLKQHREVEPMLAPMLEGMCNTLAMGIEEYVRGFDASAGIQLLSDIGSKNITTSGDAATMCLRALGLILENVPRAIDVGFGTPALVNMVRGKLSTMLALSYEVHNPGNLCEDALRIVSFLCEVDTQGMLIQSGILADIANAIDVVDSTTVDRCLAALQAILDKLLLPMPPSEYPQDLRQHLTPPPAARKDTEKKGKEAGSKEGGKSSAKKGKTQKAPGGGPGATSLQPLPEAKAAAVRRDLERKIIPMLHSLLSKAIAASTASGEPSSGGGDDVASSAPRARDSWHTIEAALMCLDTLVHRLSLSWHAGFDPALSPWVAPLEVMDSLSQCVLSQDMIAGVLSTLTGIAINEKRRLVVFSALTTFAEARRSALRGPLMERSVLDFFIELFDPSRRDLTSLLANAFPKRAQLVTGSGSAGSPGGGGGGSSSSGAASSHVTTAAAFVLVNVFAPLPSRDLHIHFRVMPVHQWEWADDMHTFTDYTDEACLFLEAGRETLRPTVNIKVRATSYLADLGSMRQTNVSSGAARPIRRAFSPKSFSFADWGSRVAALVGGAEGEPVPIADLPRVPTTTEAAADEVLALLAAYGPLLMSFAQSATNDVHRALAVTSIARMIASVTTPFPPAGFYACLDAIADELLSFISSVVASADDLLTIDLSLKVLRVIFAVAQQDGEQQLHLPRYSPNPDAAARSGHTVLGFARMCRRHGMSKKFSTLISRLRTRVDTPGSNDSAPRGSRPSRVNPGAAGAQAGCIALVSCAEDIKGLVSARDPMSASPSREASALGGDVAEDSGAAAAAAAASSPLGPHAGLASLVQQFRHAPDDARESFLLPEIVKGLADSSSGLTVHEYSSLHLTSALARYLCTATPSEEQDSADSGVALTPRQRMAQFSQHLQKHPAAAATLVSMLTLELGAAAKRMPEAQSMGSTASDKCRPWPEALQRLNDIAPNIDLCCYKSQNDDEARRKKSGSSDADKRGTACPEGHPLAVGTTSSWSCDVCHASYRTPTSRGCRECDYDICPNCATGPLPGSRASLLATVGDVETFYRLPLAERRARQHRGSSSAREAVERVERLMELLGGAPAQDDSPHGQLLRMLAAGAAVAEHAAHRGEGEDGDDDDDEEMLMQALVGGGRGGRQAPSSSAATNGNEPPDPIPPLLDGEKRRSLWYAGLGRVGFQETLFSVFYRKAMGLGIYSAAAALEDAIMVTGPSAHLASEQQQQQQKGSMARHESEQFDASPDGSPVRPTPHATPAKSRVSSAFDGGQVPSQADLIEQSMLRKRTFYFHVLHPGCRDGACICREAAVTVTNPKARIAQITSTSTPRNDDDAAAADVSDQGASSAALPLPVDEAQQRLAEDLPTEVAARPSEVAATARFTLLRILHSLCVDAVHTAIDGIPKLDRPLVNPDTFVSHDLGVRAVRAAAASALRCVVMPPQFALPAWLVETMHYAPFLIAPSVRQQLLAFLSGGARRALTDAVQGQGLFSSTPTSGCAITPTDWGTFNNNTFVNRPTPKEKLTRDAEKFEVEALETLVRTAERRFPLMFEYEGDQGTGQGPTMQFYTMVAEHLSRSGRGLWRSDTPDGDVAAGDRTVVRVPAGGLYPVPSVTPMGQEEKRAHYLCGATCARALLDGRVFPLPLSPAVFVALKRRLGLQRRGAAALHAEAALVDEDLDRVLGLLEKIYDRYAAGGPDADAAAAETEAMELTWVLPGHDDIELASDGKLAVVSPADLRRYCDLCRACLVEHSVAEALDAFVDGFRDVSPPDAALAVDGMTLCSLITGVGGDEGAALWTRDDLVKGITADHGYTRDAPQVAWLRELLLDLQPAEQRAFLRFSTGCPRLPVGGLPALGAITVVRKDAATDGALGLPSVNTCFRYLKLPPYPSKETLRDNVMKAVLNSGDGFDLS